MSCFYNHLLATAEKAKGQDADEKESARTNRDDHAEGDAERFGWQASAVVE